MGTYYQISNYDKKEEISLSSVTNIKYGSVHGWTLQTAILMVFLGSDFHRMGLKIPDEWVGRWARDSIVIENDAEDNESDHWSDGLEEREWERQDAGMLFLSDMDKRGLLMKWLEVTGLDTGGFGEEYMWEQLKKWTKLYDA